MPHLAEELHSPLFEITFAAGRPNVIKKSFELKASTSLAYCDLNMAP